MWKAALPALLALAACAHPAGGPARVEALSVGASTFLLQYWPGDDEAVRQVKGALAEAVPRSARWATLLVPVLLTIHPTHEALEAATHRTGYSWLRAWARYDSVDLQSPRTWLMAGAGHQRLAELLAHELTHCALYQSSASPSTWAVREIPLWFREGMASLAAGQGYRWARPEAIWRFYREAAGSASADPGHPARAAGDPLTDPEPLYRRDSEVVYGTAHWAFRFLLDRYGEHRVRDLVALMSRGRPFAEAFREASGIALADFEADFRRYVVWQGWRR
jgi:hypothetical protein